MAAWPPASQVRALIAAKASAGLTGAAEGEPKQCAVARPPESVYGEPPGSSGAESG